MDNSNFILYNMIGRDENILWSGKPNFKCFILEAIFNPLLFVAIIWGLIDFAFIGAAFSTNTHEIAKEMHNSHFFTFMIGFFSLHLMPVWIYLFGAVSSFLRYKHTEYVITDKGVYCSDGVFSQTFEHKPFAELSHVNINRGIIDQMIGVGDVILTSTQVIVGRHSNTFGTISICDIPDYNEVYKLAKELQEKIYSDTMYPNEYRPK